LQLLVSVDNHRSFKLRLPSIRKDLCRRMLSRGGAGSLIPDVESLPVSPVSENQLTMSADASLLSASKFGRLLAAEHDNIATDIGILSPPSRRPMLNDIETPAMSRDDRDSHLLQQQQPPPNPSSGQSLTRINHDAILSSSNNHTSTDSEPFAELQSADNRLLKSIPQGVATLEHELISPAKRLDRDAHSVMSSAAKQGYMLPTANVKHNVTEKVAQVSNFC
jgi:hypothetical protein